MHLLRGLHFICAFYNINLRATHIQFICGCHLSQQFTGIFQGEPNSQERINSNPRATVGGASVVSTRLAVADLERIANHLVKGSIADSTRRCYTTGQTTYLTFCSRLNMQPLPATEQLLIIFTADLSQRLAFSSIRAYLSAVRFLHISNGHSDPLSGKLKLDLLLRRVRKRKPGSHDKRLPITPLILQKLFSILNQNPTDLENKLNFFFGPLAVWGFSVFFVLANLLPSQRRTTQHGICRYRISTEKPSFLKVYIKGSKTDQLRQGTTVVVGRTKSHISPVKSVLAYVACRGFKSGPLFCHQNGSPLTRSQLVNGLRSALSKAGVKCDNFSGHSFRIGAATSYSCCQRNG